MQLIRLVPLFALLAVTGCAPPEQPSGQTFSPQEITANNQGVGLMGQYRNEEAREIFAQLAAERPDWLDVRVNLAIATLNRQQEGDERRALELALAVLAEDPGHERATYIAGLMHLYLGESERALEYLRRVATAAPEDAHAAYFTGQAMVQLGRIDEASQWYRSAIERDPYLRSAYYGAALALRRLGRVDAAQQMLADYQRFENNPRAHLAEFRYTRKGPRAEAKAVDPEALPPAQEPDGPLFGAMRVLAPLPVSHANPTLTTVDLAGNGLQDLFVAGGPGAPTLVYLNDGQGGFSFAPDHPLGGHLDVTAALWGDIDNSGRVDAFLCRHGANLLFMQSTDGWAEVGASAGLADEGHCVSGSLFDADHDGDLDILVVNADRPNELFSNNLDGTFRRLAGPPDAEISGGPRASIQSLVADLDADRDADIVIVHAAPPHEVFRNDRLWRYQEAAGFERFQAAAVVAVSAADFEADGQLSLVTIDPEGTLAKWRPDAAGDWQETILLSRAVPQPDSAAIAVLDLDGSGRPELLVQHAQGFEVFQLQPGGGVESLYRARQPLAALAAILLDVGAGPALAGISADAEGRNTLVLWPAGEGRHAFMSVQPTGRTDRGDGMRSNASGIGTGLLLRAGDRWAVTDTYDRHSAPGQSLQPAALGLGGRTRAEFLQLFWTDGVFQTEMNLAANELHRIAEYQRQLASCPVLFAWNGERFEFVSDLLGVGGLGFLLEPGQYSEPRPWEYFKFPAGALAPRDGRYALKIAEPMEEIAYLDTLRLHLFDLPAGWGMTLDERMHTGGGPAPTGAPVFYRESDVISLARATNDRGEDVTELLRENDQRAAPPGKVDARFLARLANDHVLELEFERVINPDGSRPVLVADGWVEYPYSQTVFAAWQAGADYSPPTLEARGADGRWQVVYENFGYPAGMPREMSVPLEGLPTGTTALRLHSNWEIYWDRIAVVHAEDPPAAIQHHLAPLVEARMAKTGFARRDNLPQRRPYYDYEDRSPFWDTRYPSGYYTALGPVLPLVAEQNDAFAVIGPGDELHAEFRAPAEAPNGWHRVIVLEVRGFAKDMDMYTKDGDTVGPLPSTPGVGDPAIREALHEHYLNRYQGGR